MILIVDPQLLTISTSVNYWSTRTSNFVNYLVKMAEILNIKLADVIFT